MKAPYCDDCIHQQVCKFTKQVKEYEEKAPVVQTVVGPVIAYNIECKCKLTRRDFK